MFRTHSHYSLFFFNDTATTEIYTLSLHDALPILDEVAPPESPGFLNQSEKPFSSVLAYPAGRLSSPPRMDIKRRSYAQQNRSRSEEHTSELQSQSNLVCRLLLEKKNNDMHTHMMC